MSRRRSTSFVQRNDFAACLRAVESMALRILRARSCDFGALLLSRVSQRHPHSCPICLVRAISGPVAEASRLCSSLIQVRSHDIGDILSGALRARGRRAGIAPYHLSVLAGHAATSGIGIRRPPCDLGSRLLARFLCCGGPPKQFGRSVSRIWRTNSLLAYGTR